MYKIETDYFQGPFDLLLSLIEKNKIDIYTVRLSDITEDFLREVEALKTINPENIADFVFLASTLLEIKSKKLLPKNEFLDEEETVTEEMILTRLREYKKIKELSQELQKHKDKADSSYPKLQEDLSDFFEDKRENKIIGDGTILYNELCKVLNRIEKRQKNLEKFDILQREEFSVDEYMDVIRDNLKPGRKKNFSDFFHDNMHVSEMITLFLSILELLKINEVKLYQNENFDEIFIELRCENEL
ncbi:segregation and condensation protein A [Mediannikoviicoccus vaginalis]|uniref:segregation and condensation protein A n=1 Tax=Mediannikoviicoccus vaginalis TaxID=2899727 RepID=UPI001F196D96|nr:segregation/condensation protein A [Mediannikoviicoccus vaginalis]